MPVFDETILAYHLDDTHGVHIFTFFDNSRRAADEYLRVADDALAEWVESGNGAIPFRLLLDISQAGVFPLQYTLNKSRQLVSKFTGLPPRKIAFLTDSAKDIALLRSILHLPNSNWRNKRRIFPPTQREDAIAWLYQDDEATE